MRNLLLICVSAFIFTFVFFNSSQKTLLKEKTNDVKTAKIENGKDILLKMKQKYESLTYYKSKGVAEFPELSSFETSNMITTNFKFTFEAPSKINLSWYDSDVKSINSLLADGDEILLCVDGAAEKKFEVLSTAINYVSSRDAIARFEVADLILFKENPPNRAFISKLKDVEILADEIEDGGLCYKIKGDLYGVATDVKAVFTYWIDKETFLVKRVDRLLIPGDNPAYSRYSSEKYSEIEAR